jgi:uncharacterized protein (TIGR02145 family)
MGTAIVDGLTYNTTVGPDGREWFAENVRGTRFSSAGDSAGRTFTQDGTNDFYDWLVLNDTNGWRVPTDAEWYSVGSSMPGTSYLTANGYAGIWQYSNRFVSSNPGPGARLKLPGGWNSPYNAPPYVSTDEYGFSFRNSSNVSDASIFRCYAPTFPFPSNTPIWFVWEGSSSFLRQGAKSPNELFHLRLVRDIPSTRIYVPHAGIWKPAKEIWVLHAGVWNKASAVHVPDAAAWKQP